MSFLSPPQGFQATSVTAAAFPLLGPNGSAAAPTYSFSSSGNADNGLYLSADNVPAIAAAGAGILFVAANLVEQRNSTTAQNLKIYNTFTDTSNYEALRLGYTSNFCDFVHEVAGTGSQRAIRISGSQIYFQEAGTSRWNMIAGGHLVCPTDNAVDFGASGATRPRTGYFGTSVNVVAGAVLLDTNGITMGDAKNIILNATTGTKFGTATSQKLAFYNATPVAQQTGVAVTAAGIHAALVTLGLITA